MKLAIILILIWFILGFYNLSRVHGNAEGDALYTMKMQFTDPANALQTWDQVVATPCTWFHVTCNDQSSVTRIDLGGANLSGQLVPELGQLTNLMYLGLYNNEISGRIPDELGNLTKLVNLDLYQNRLNGNIPVTLGKLQKLRNLRLNNNSLTGTIPESLTNVSLQILDLSNNLLSGVVPVTGSFSNFTPISFKNNPNLTFQSISPQAPPTNPKPGRSATGAIAGGVAGGAALLFAVPTIALVWWCSKKAQDDFYDIPAEQDPAVHLGQLKRFSLRELQVATDNFSRNNILGQGGFGRVYRGRLADGRLVAVKRLKEERPHGSELQFQTEVEMINRHEMQAVLNWETRERVALGSARGLAYLHEHCSPKIIHRDVKAANILLDEVFQAVVGDFGLAKLMNYKDTHVTTAIRGTIGHIAPEYLSTGRSSEKTDVFGYGVMLLELITGQRAYDLARQEKDDEVMLLDWVKGLLEAKKLETLVDADLEGGYVNDGVEKLIKIALLCTQNAPLDRPDMSEVVRMLEDDGLTERWDQWQNQQISRQEISHEHNFIYYIDPNSHNPSLEQLSGPR